MRLRHLEVFYAVYTNGSISAAARVLGISQPSVSKALHHAQDQIGFRLFRLVRGRLVATDEAHALFREAGDVFERLSSLQQTAHNLKSMGGGHIRLAVVPSLGLVITPKAIAEYRSANPGVTFDVQTLHHDDLVQALHGRECDLAIAYDPPAHPRLVAKTIATGELAILFRRGSIECSSERLSLSVLRELDVVSVTSSGPLGDLLASRAQELGLNFRQTVSVQTFYIAAALVQFGGGVTVIDEFTARARQSEELEYRLVDPPLRFSVQCVTLEERPLSRAARRFIELLTRSLQESNQSAHSLEL